MSYRWNQDRRTRAGGGTAGDAGIVMATMKRRGDHRVRETVVMSLMLAAGLVFGLLGAVEFVERLLAGY